MNLKGCFRPLSGSYISQYSFAFLFLYQFLTVSVPYRGATFLNEVFKYYKKKNKPVSVPYRGATFLNNALMNSEEIFYDVSVPYRGATFLNIYPILSSVFIFEFPSPIGELHFSIVYL